MAMALAGPDRINMSSEQTVPTVSDQSVSIPSEVLDLVRFMCDTWSDIDRWAYRDACDAIMTYPVIQGTLNQLHLAAIGKQKYCPERVSAAVKWMLDQ